MKVSAESFEMPRPREKLDKLGQAEQVIARLKNEPPGLARERLNAVKLGIEAEYETARRCGVSVLGLCRFLESQ